MRITGRTGEVGGERRKRPRRRSAYRVPAQLSFGDAPKPTWGGARDGAGRPKGANPRIRHRIRDVFSGLTVVHVTVKMSRDVWNLRSRQSFRVIERALYHAAHHSSARLVQFSVQGNHIHLLVEALDPQALARCIQGFAIRTAKGLNRMMGRRGAVFSDRYHSRVVKTPTEARRVMAYLRSNTRKHAVFPDERVQPGYVDPFSSEGRAYSFAPPAAATWLLRIGWQRGRP